MPTGRGHLAANTEIFASLFLALSVLIFLSKAKEEGAGLDVPQWRAGRRGDFVSATFAVTLGAMLAYLVYVWLIPRYPTLGRFGSRHRCGDWIRRP